MATLSSTLVWKIPWTEEPGRLQSMGWQSQTQLSNFTFTFTFRFTAKLNRKNQELLSISCSHTCTTSPINIFHQNGTICYNWWICIDIQLSESIVYTGFSLSVIHYGCWQIYNDMIHHYSIIKNSVTALKMLCTQFIHPSLTPALGNHWYFFCLHKFTFLECYIAEIIHYEVFSDWYLSLKNIHLNFLEILS